MYKKKSSLTDDNHDALTTDDEVTLINNELDANAIRILPKFKSGRLETLYSWDSMPLRRDECVVGLLLSMSSTCLSSIVAVIGYIVHEPSLTGVGSTDGHFPAYSQTSLYAEYIAYNLVEMFLLLVHLFLAYGNVRSVFAPFRMAYRNPESQQFVLTTMACVRGLLAIVTLIRAESPTLYLTTFVHLVLSAVTAVGVGGLNMTNATLAFGVHFLPFAATMAFKDISFNRSEKPVEGFTWAVVSLLGIMVAYLELQRSKELDLRISFLTGRRGILQTNSMEQLLYSNLPEHVVMRLRVSPLAQVFEPYHSVTVCFIEIKGCDELAQFRGHRMMIQTLDRCWSAIDNMTSSLGVWKVEHVLNEYMFVAGCPYEDPNHVANAANAAQLFLKEIRDMLRISAIELTSSETFRISSSTRKINIDVKSSSKDFRTPANLEIKVGIHTGPVTGAAVGLVAKRYCLFGDTVNMAARMKSYGAPHRIHVSEAVAKELSGNSKFTIIPRGELDIKGKGMCQTFWLGSAPNDIKSIQERSELGFPMLRKLENRSGENTNAITKNQNGIIEEQETNLRTVSPTKRKSKRLGSTLLLPHDDTETITTRSASCKVTKQTSRSQHQSNVQECSNTSEMNSIDFNNGSDSETSSVCKTAPNSTSNFSQSNPQASKSFMSSLKSKTRPSLLQTKSFRFNMTRRIDKVQPSETSKRAREVLRLDQPDENLEAVNNFKAESHSRNRLKSSFSTQSLKHTVTAMTATPTASWGKENSARKPRLTNNNENGIAHKPSSHGPTTLHYDKSRTNESNTLMLGKAGHLINSYSRSSGHHSASTETASNLASAYQTMVLLGSRFGQHGSSDHHRLSFNLSASNPMYANYQFGVSQDMGSEGSKHEYYSSANGSTSDSKTTIQPSQRANSTYDLGHSECKESESSQVFKTRVKSGLESSSRIANERMNVPTAYPKLEQHSRDDIRSIEGKMSNSSLPNSLVARHAGSNSNIASRMNAKRRSSLPDTQLLTITPSTEEIDYTEFQRKVHLATLVFLVGFFTVWLAQPGYNGLFVIEAATLCDRETLNIIALENNLVLGGSEPGLDLGRLANNKLLVNTTGFTSSYDCRVLLVEYDEQYIAFMAVLGALLAQHVCLTIFALLFKDLFRYVERKLLSISLGLSLALINTYTIVTQATLNDSHFPRLTGSALFVTTSAVLAGCFQCQTMSFFKAVVPNAIVLILLAAVEEFSWAEVSINTTVDRIGQCGVIICLILVVGVVLWLRQRTNMLLVSFTHELLMFERATKELLNTLFTERVATRLISSDRQFVERCPESTILMCDIVGSTKLAAGLEPGEVAELLHVLYTEFDTIALRHGVQKITTIGDAYVAAAGPCISSHSSVEGAEAIVSMACDMIEASRQVSYNFSRRSTWDKFRTTRNIVTMHHELAGGNVFRKPRTKASDDDIDSRQLSIRIGVDTGMVYGGVVGQKQLAYQIWGEALLDATEMESTARPETVHLSKSCIEFLGGPDKLRERLSQGDSNVFHEDGSLILVV